MADGFQALGSGILAAESVDPHTGAERTGNSPLAGPVTLEIEGQRY